MKNKKRIAFCAVTILLLIALGALMMWIGRGHTIYFDNKTLEYKGTEYKYFHRVDVLVNGEREARLAKKERGQATCMGQKFAFSLDVTENKGDEPVHYDFSIDLPYSIDGIVINVPAFLAELPQEAWQSEFVPLVVEEEEEEILTDEFGNPIQTDEITEEP